MYELMFNEGYNDAMDEILNEEEYYENDLLECIDILNEAYYNADNDIDAVYLEGYIEGLQALLEARPPKSQRRAATKQQQENKTLNKLALAARNKANTMSGLKAKAMSTHSYTSTPTPEKSRIQSLYQDTAAKLNQTRKDKAAITGERDKAKARAKSLAQKALALRQSNRATMADLRGTSQALDDSREANARSKSRDLKHKNKAMAIARSERARANKAEKLSAAYYDQVVAGERDLHKTKGDLADMTKAKQKAEENTARATQRDVKHKDKLVGIAKQFRNERDAEKAAHADTKNRLATTTQERDAAIKATSDERAAHAATRGQLDKTTKQRNIAVGAAGVAGAGLAVAGGAKAIDKIKYNKYKKANKHPVSYAQWVANGKPLKESFNEGYYDALCDLGYYDEY